MPSNNSNRGSIFKPFDALSGFSEEINKKQTETVSMPELSQDRLEELQEVFNEITIGTNVTIKYYKRNSFIEFSGSVKYIDTIYKKILLVNDDETDNIDVTKIIDIKINR